MENMKKMMPMIMVMAIIVIASIFYLSQGIGMHNKVAVEEKKFHDLQSGYWSIDKVTRDSAATDSELNKQLVQIQNYPSTLLELKLVGVGKILTGIYALLLGILMALIIMPVRLGRMIGNLKR